MVRYKSALQSKWNTESEKMVKQIGERAEGYIWMCDMDASYYSKLHNSFILISGLLSVLVGATQIMLPKFYKGEDCEIVTNFNGTSSEECTPNDYPETIMGVINLVIGGLIAIMKFNDYSSFVDRLKRSSGKFRDLQSDVQQQLSMQRVDRMPAIDYIKAISHQYNKITSNKTFKIRRSTVDKLKKLYSGSSVALPEIAGDIKEIAVAKTEEDVEKQEEAQDDENNIILTGDEVDDEYSHDDENDEESDVTSTGDFDASAPTMPKPEKQDDVSDSSPNIIAIPGTSTEVVSTKNLDSSGTIDHVRIRISDTDTPSSSKPSPPIHTRKNKPALVRKKSMKSPKRTVTAYPELRYHDHRPNLQEINFQLSRFGKT